MTAISHDLPVIIAGAGIVGLTLAQALKQAGIPFQIYDKDSSLESNTGGWAITIHWALSAFETCLPPALFDQLQDIQVDPEQGRNDTGKFLFLDLATAKPVYEIPPSKRMRVNRRLLRQLLAQDLDIRWRNAVADFKVSDESIQVQLADGSFVDGSLLIGADGSNSTIRRVLIGEDHSRLLPLDVSCLGVTARMTAGQVKPLREIDPLLFQGCHPASNDYLWYSTVSTPEINHSLGEQAYYEGQVIMSWRLKSAADNIPVDNEARLQIMKQKAQAFEPRLCKLVHDLPANTQVLEIKLADWPTKAWNNHRGRVTLMGDAAHAMTMYRGEAFNHGITDAAKLADRLMALQQDGIQSLTLESAVTDYESEMRQRTHDAVLLSRQACLDAHDLSKLTKDSPLVSRRARITTADTKT